MKVTILYTDVDVDFFWYKNGLVKCSLKMGYLNVVLKKFTIYLSLFSFIFVFIFHFCIVLIPDKKKKKKHFVFVIPFKYSWRKSFHAFLLLLVICTGNCEKEDLDFF